MTCPTSPNLLAPPYTPSGATSDITSRLTGQQMGFATSSVGQWPLSVQSLIGSFSVFWVLVWIISGCSTAQYETGYRAKVTPLRQANAQCQADRYQKLVKSVHTVINRPDDDVQPADVTALDLAVQIQDCGLLGIKTEYNAMQSQLGPLVPSVISNKDISPSQRTELLADIAEIYLRHGYGYLAKQVMEQLPSVRHTDSLLVARLDHLRAAILLAKGANFEAKDLANKRILILEHALQQQGPKNKDNRIALILADLWIVALEATISTGDHPAFVAMLPNAEGFFDNKLKGSTVQHFYFQLAKAHAYDQQADRKKAKEAFEKAVSLGGKGNCYPKSSLPVLRANSELIGMLYETGLSRPVANRVETIINTVDHKWVGIAEYEAIKSLTILREYASRGLQDQTFEELRAILHFEDQTYQYNPELSKQIQEIAYKIALQFDSTEMATTALQKLIGLGQLIGGPKSAIYGRQVINKAYYEGLYAGRWSACLDTFKVYFEPIIKPTYVAGHANRVLLQGLYARCLDETDQLRAARKQLTDNQRAVKSTWGEDHPLYAAQLQQLADVELSIGGYLQAEDHLVKALEIASKPENRSSPVHVATLRQLIRLYLLYGEYDLAEEFIGYAMAAEGRIYLTPTLLAEQSDDLEPVLAYLRGQYRKAETGFMTQLIRAEQRGPSAKAKMIAPLMWLGQTYLQLGDYASAEKSAKEAAQYAVIIYGDSSRKHYQCLAVLQKLYRLMGDQDKSIALSTRIVNKYRRTFGPNHVEVAEAITEQAMATYLKQDSARLVLPLLIEARNIYLNNFGENHPLYADALKNIAALYIDLEKDDSAHIFLDKAAQIYRQKLGRKPVQLIEVLTLLGDLARYTGAFDQANQHYDQAIKLLSNNFDETHPKLLMLKGRKARCLALDGQTRQAQKQMQATTAGYLKYFESYFPYLSEREKANLWQQSQPEFNFFAALVAQSEQEDRTGPELLYNHCLATKGILLSNSQSLRNKMLKSLSPDMLRSYRQWQTNKEQLAGLLANAKDNKEASATDLSKLQEQTEALEKELNERSADFAQMNRSSRLPTYDQVLKRLGKQEYAIEIIRTIGYEASTADTISYVALLIGGPHKRPEMIRLTSGKYLEQKAIRYYRNAMRYNLPDTLSYQVFWRQLAPHIPKGSTVYLSADGVYNQLNPAGLQRHLGQFLSDEINLISVSNTAELIKAAELAIANNGGRSTKNAKTSSKTAGTPKSALLVGNPTYYSTLAQRQAMTALGTELKQLPGTEAETQAIAKVLKGDHWSITTLLGTQAKEETIRNSDIPEVLHIATHGAFVSEEDENAKTGLKAEVQTAETSLLKVGLVLAGGGDLVNEDSTTNLNQRSGVLTAYEAMNMNLSRTELVVLSACETGAGHLQNGEGVYGLQRAFLVAGAHNVIFSFFKVDDKITTELMTAFYQNWIGGQTKRAAFAEAQQMTRRKHPSNPAYWASFTMLGL